MTRLVESSSAHLRLEAARAFAREHATRGDVWLVGASRGAADDLARSIAVETGASIGLHRFSLGQLAARLAAPGTRRRGSRAGHLSGLRSRGGARDVRRAAGRRTLVLRARGVYAWVSARARAHSPGTAARSGGARRPRPPVVRRTRSRRADAGLRRSVRRRSRHRPRRPVRRRHARPPVRTLPAPGDGSCSTCPSIRRPNSTSSALFSHPPSRPPAGFSSPFRSVISPPWIV